MQPHPADPKVSRRRRTVVVGVDGEPAAEAALGWALREADQHGLQVELVTAWLPFPGMPDPVSYRRGHEWATRVQADALAAARPAGRRMPTVTGVVAEGSPAAVLARAAEGAAFLVVGRRSARLPTSCEPPHRIGDEVLQAERVGAHGG